MRPLSLLLPLLASTAWAGPTCQDVTLEVKAAALNIEIPPLLSLNITLGLLTSLPKKGHSAAYKIAARYCEPEVVKQSRRNTLQILVHGVTYTKDYWSGLGPPGHGFDGNTYSYVDYASKRGFPTLAIDRICNGDSDKPPALLVCQLPYNMEVLHEIIHQVHSTAVVGGRPFNKVIPVCHSEGSTTCQYLMQVQPQAPVATYILTAFTNKFVVGAHDFNTTHPVPVGEVATSLLSQLPAREYRGSVLVLNGANDQIFCAVLPLDPLLGDLGDCGQGAKSVTVMTGQLFSRAKVTAKQVGNTGHDLHLHRTAGEMFREMNDYLVAEGF